MASSKNKTQSVIPTRSSSRLKGTTSATARSSQDGPASKPTRKPKESANPPARRSRENNPQPVRNTLLAVEVPTLASLRASEKPLHRQLPSTATDQREAIKAYLRIRPPPLGGPNDSLYLSKVTATSVVMTNPISQQSRIARLRPAEAKSSTYQFTRVFPPETLQPEFFAETTLPLVRDLLSGENGLIFAYGVTNSGKTFTVQGGKHPGQRGLLPRALDVIFNSIEGLHSKAPLRPVRLASVEVDPEGSEHEPSFLTGMAPDASQSSTSGSGILLAVAPDEIDQSERDKNIIPVDTDYEYAVWVSYAEIYQEKIFDLLDALPAGASVSHPPPSLSQITARQSGGLSRTNTASSSNTINATSLSFAANKRFSNTFSAFASLSSDKVPTIVRKTLKLATDTEGGCKYIVGLRELRVHSAEEAKAVVTHGQMNRRVFGTLANSHSSRSHAVFTIKVIKVHKGSPNDPDAVMISRLSIVDLAGSERVKNTHSTGERLKEGASINKSLMTLGLCMDVMKKNQHRLMDYLSGIKNRASHDKEAPSKASDNGNDSHAADGKYYRTPSGSSGIPLKLDNFKSKVPFVYSRLTELFQDFLEGHGKAVLLVNINPYTTGYDENSHVMEFAALASEITTWTNKVSTPTTVLKPPMKTMATGLAPNLVSGKRVSSNTRTVSLVSPTSDASDKDEQARETLYNVVEEDEQDSDEEDDSMIDRLFTIIEELKEKLYDAELRYAMATVTVRDQVAEEYEERIREMEEIFRRRRMQDEKEYENKMDKKIDILYRAGAVGQRRPDIIEEEEDERDVDASLIIDSSGLDSGDESPSPSTAQDQLKYGTTPNPNISKSDDGTISEPIAGEQSIWSGRDSRGGDVDMAERGDDSQVAGMSSLSEGEMSTDEGLSSAQVGSYEPLESALGGALAEPKESADTLLGDVHKSKGSSSGNVLEPRLPETSQTKRQCGSTVGGDLVKTSSNAAAKRSVRTTKSIPLQQPQYDMSLDEIVVLPSKARSHQLSTARPIDEHDGDSQDGEYASEVPPEQQLGATDIMKKKKRHLGKKAPLTEDQILQVAQQVEERDQRSKRKHESVRRMG